MHVWFVLFADAARSADVEEDADIATTIVMNLAGDDTARGHGGGGGASSRSNNMSMVREVICLLSSVTAPCQS
jgi:hypothetical protein